MPLFQPRAPAWETIAGDEEILARKPLLLDLAQRSGQEGILEFLDYFLAAPYFGLNVPEGSWQVLKLLPDAALMSRTKMPRLLLRTSGSEVDAAVFVFEYGLHGIPTRCFIPMDEDGYRSVIAPARHRTEAALQAGRYLLSKGALVALMSYMPGAEEEGASALAKLPGVLGYQARVVERKLRLASTFEQTLESMSRNTRHNLRRARQQISHACGAVYVADAVLTAEELLDLNSSTQFSAPEWAARERYEKARDLNGGVLAGLRGADGRWLSLIGGHRELDTVCLDWQMNRSELGSISVAVAMRAFLIEHEIARGTRWVRFERGTTHPMHGAFLKEWTHDLLFARKVLPRWLLKHLGSGAKGGLLPSILGSPSLVWSN